MSTKKLFIVEYERTKVKDAKNVKEQIEKLGYDAICAPEGINVCVVDAESVDDSLWRFGVGDKQDDLIGTVSESGTVFNEETI
jgi:hypothetical protein